MSGGSGGSQQLLELSIQQGSAALSRETRHPSGDIDLRAREEAAESGTQRFLSTPSWEQGRGHSWNLASV